jgi:Rrf2 family nitric oxide-sensitive transcriptional repressor
MQLTAFTDYALRTLIGLGAVAPEKLTMGQLSEAYGISVHHLLKIVNELAALGYVETLRGKAGGARLAQRPDQIVIGTVVRQMERDLGVVPCLRAGEAPCVIAPACRLKRLFEGATQRFLEELDGHTLADLLEPRRKLQALLQLSVTKETPKTSPAPRGAARTVVVARERP